METAILPESPEFMADTPKRGLRVPTIVLAILWRFGYRVNMELRPVFNLMLRILSIFGMAAAFLWISPPLRVTVLTGLGQATLMLAKFSPYSYILLALTLGAGAVMSLASPKPQ